MKVEIAAKHTNIYIQFPAYLLTNVTG